MTIGWNSTSYTVAEFEGILVICATAQSWTTSDSATGVRILSQSETALREYELSLFLPV